MASTLSNGSFAEQSIEMSDPFNAGILERLTPAPGFSSSLHEPHSAASSFNTLSQPPTLLCGTSCEEDPPRMQPGGTIDRLSSAAPNVATMVWHNPNGIEGFVTTAQYDFMEFAEIPTSTSPNLDSSAGLFNVGMESFYPSKEDWNTRQRSSADLNAYYDLKGSPFPRESGPEGASTTPVYVDPISSVHSSSLNPPMILPFHCSQSTGHIGAQPSPQMNLPTFSTPQEQYAVNQFASCPAEGTNMDRLFNCLSSSDIGSPAWDFFEQISQDKSYLCHAESDHDTTVKKEPLLTPPSSRKSSFAPLEDDDYASIEQNLSFPPTTNTKPSTRSDGLSDKAPFKLLSPNPDKLQAPHRAWYEGYGPSGCHIRCEGKRFALGIGHNGAIEQVAFEASAGGAHKPHKCDQCGRRFERSEHLKRHMGMHSNERPFPCPLPDCNKKIGRPDNAGDHFKTHLRPPTKGKRNKHYKWAFFKACILKEYPEPQAMKVLSKLSRWMVNEKKSRMGFI